MAKMLEKAMRKTMKALDKDLEAIEAQMKE